MKPLPFAMRYARFEAVEDFLRVGWMIAIPNALMHHHVYGIELAWLCACPVPGGFSVSTRVPHTLTDENATDGIGT